MASMWQQWVERRFKIDQHKQLTQKDVLIFIYQQGYLYLVLIFITFIAGVNYANNLILGFCFLISAVLCISFYITFKQLHALQIQINVVDTPQVGELLLVDIYFKQDVEQGRYLWIKTENQLHKLLFNTQQHGFQLNFITSQRGVFQIPPIQIYSVYPFGLVRAWTYLYVQQPAWVAPQASWHSVENKQQQQNFEPDLDEFRELRSFQTGDSLHAVSWKQAARGQGLYVKVFEQYEDLKKLEIHYHHMPAPSHEEKLSLMMGLVEQAEKNHDQYALYLPNAELASGTGALHFSEAKRLLAQA
ncbi:MULTISPECIES: DUF58 domain-containing protein [unclassified Acinetobacter]|uniref:DUF58 domain-containing protein n=1 Tax=unclassified Acinetobacter TaxID=196816 RepID=UPI0015D35589|nr:MULTISPECIES: DUF58 domain-containing protein [unclassified Acinetobacter]